ncbi:uncharacterized protein K02A2.6-like [Achroia grisella]|uniref:uncharacterized protein K02A2.6-like n=1 Tax=Achroia grisella TaxID=688607 RepID=UPI0027D26B77|nr:uncharacterized protein K02A2.6-like [Achroia grisella]
MDMLKPPPSLSFTGDIAENYKRFKQRYQLYVKASGADVKLDDEGQIALFLHTIGDEVIQIYNTFDLTSSTKFDDLIKKFDNYFIPQKNESMNRHIFFSRVMKEDECIDDYVTELRILSNDCNFESLRDSLIRDQIIRGIREKSLRERLLKEHGLDLNKCIQICKTFEITCIQMQKFEKEKIEVAEIKKSSKYEYNKSQTKGKSQTAQGRQAEVSIHNARCIKEKEIEAQVGMIIENIPVKSCRLEEIKKETENDREFKLLKKYIIEGWPDNIEKVPDSLRDYCTFKEELFVYDDLIFKNNCVVIPMSMRQNMLEQLHYNHLGIEKCKARARSCIFWPHMNKEIENKVQNCNTCCRFKKRNSKEPMTIRDMPHKPWSVLGSDVFYYKEKPFLIIVDHYSKYFEIISLSNLSAEVTIAAFKSVFARFGIPDILYSDNGTNFCNQKFREFTKNWNFTHRTSSPTFPQSNGLAERYVQTVKNLFKKADYEKKDKYLALLEYRNTPKVEMENKTPSELLMNRNVQGLLPQYSCPISMT